MQESDQRQPIISRAQSVATGLADVGLAHAEEFLRRMSPEGREQMRRERAAKSRRQQQFITRLLMSAIVSLLAWAALAGMVPASIASAVAVALMLLLVAVIFFRAAPRAPGREALVQASLAGLTEEAVVWLAAQRRGLPPAALSVADLVSNRLDELTPRLAFVDQRSPAAAAFHKLIAVELPDLVEGWRSVPSSTRGVPQPDGHTANEHLTNGLKLIDLELSRVSEQLQHGTLNEIAVQGRYLELKYNADSRLR